VIRRVWRSTLVALTLVRVAWMWPRIAVGAGLGRRTDEARRSGRRWAVSAPAGIVVATRPRLSDFPRLSHWCVGPYGWRARLKLRPGDTPETVAEATSSLRESFRAAVVSVRPTRPGWCELVVLRRDPLSAPPLWAPAALSPTAVRVGVVDDGSSYVVDFRRLPHWLTCGATNAGKSSLTSALFAGLAPTDAALLGIDCKHGVEQSLMAARLTELATSPAEALAILERLHRLIRARAEACLAHRVRNVFDLPTGSPERRPVVVLVDEVAELLLITGDDKDLPKRLGVALLRLVQLGRAFAVFVVIAGQRFGSDIGGPVTSIRAQCAGRVAMRVADAETARMTLGDIAADAVEAATSIPADLPGVAVATGGPAGWQRVRALYVPAERVDELAAQHAARRPSWADLEASGRTPRPIPEAVAA
jgi:S-DNA-T family DNA segregation ATPase FtsK/SpoIIIE